MTTLSVLAPGCASVQQGKALKGEDYPRGRTPIVAEVSTAQADGLRVLFNGVTWSGEHDQVSWIAGNPSQLAALWNKVGLHGDHPEVDFSQYFVVGTAGPGSWCTSEITRLTIDTRGISELRYEKPVTCPASGQCTCEEAGVGNAQVVALPRRLFGKTLVLRSFDVAFRFDVPEPGPALQQPVSPVSQSDFSRAQLVDLPPKGHMSLRTLRSGSEVWVTRDTDDSVSVFSASYFSNEFSFLGTALRYGKVGRFVDDYDAHGRYIHGVPFVSTRGLPLQGYRCRRQDETHVFVGEPTEILPGPIQPRSEAPILDGPDRPYTHVPPVPSWDELADGKVALLDIDVIAAPSSDVRLCKLPKKGDAVHASCPQIAPYVAEYPRKLGGRSYVVRGPLVVLRHGGSATILARPPFT